MPLSSFINSGATTRDQKRASLQTGIIKEVSLEEVTFESLSLARTGRVSLLRPSASLASGPKVGPQHVC